MLFGRNGKRESDNTGYGGDYYSSPMDTPVNDEQLRYGAENEMPVIEEKQTVAQGAKQNFGGIANSEVRLKVMNPKNFGEATKVADNLIAGSTVVLNIEALEEAEMVRFMDFLMGVLYVINGNMKDVSKTTIVVSPSGIAEDEEVEEVAENAENA